MFSVKCSNFNSDVFKMIIFNIAEHRIFYETHTGIHHVIGCDFSSIFDDLRSIITSNNFRAEALSYNPPDGYYEFSYNFQGYIGNYSGSVKGTKYHSKVINLINSCAKECLDDEVRLIKNNWGKTPSGATEQWALDIMNKRQRAYNKILDKSYKKYMSNVWW